MGDQARWREIMYQVMWLGEEPEWTAEELKAQREAQKDSATRGLGSPVTKAQTDALAEMMKRAEELRSEAEGN